MSQFTRKFAIKMDADPKFAHLYIQPKYNTNW